MQSWFSTSDIFRANVSEFILLSQGNFLQTVAVESDIMSPRAKNIAGENRLNMSLVSVNVGEEEI